MSAPTRRVRSTCIDTADDSHLPARTTLTFAPVDPSGRPWHGADAAPRHEVTCSACGERWHTNGDPSTYATSDTVHARIRAAYWVAGPVAARRVALGVD